MSKRNIVKELNLHEISFVNKPAQAHALATIVKCAVSDEIIQKLSTTEGAKTFSEFLDSDVREARAWKAQEKVWPVTDAFRGAVNSIVADANLSGDDKINRIANAANEFVGAIQQYIPDVQEALQKMLTQTEKDIPHMTDATAKVAELEKKVADLTAENASLSVLAHMNDLEKAYAARLPAAEAALFKSHDSVTRQTIVKAAAASDETVTIDGNEIRKSLVGDSVFATLRKQSEDLAKAREAVETAEFKKAAADNFKNLPGTEDAKIGLLKAIRGISAESRATFDAIVKAGNDSLSGAFREIGANGGADKLEKADELEKLVKSYMGANAGVTRDKAVSTVLATRPDLY